MSGKRKRITEKYLIDEEGVIIQANDKVKAAEDSEKMLAEIS